MAVLSRQWLAEYFVIRFIASGASIDATAAVDICRLVLQL
jgi:hypothetical protein